MPQLKVILQIMLRQDHGKAKPPGENTEAPGKIVQVRENYRGPCDLEVLQLKIKKKYKMLASLQHHWT